MIVVVISCKKHQELWTNIFKRNVLGFYDKLEPTTFNKA
jgi:hypothetical protein